jgi:hypothetical protein
VCMSYLHKKEVLKRQSLIKYFSNNMNLQIPGIKVRISEKHTKFEKIFLMVLTFTK